MELVVKLSQIQNEINVPKNLFNKFGNYYYRNAETILESAKPICAKYKTTLKVEDEIVLVGDRFYVKAIAQLIDWESDKIITNTAFAREALDKKGMDESQITGATSSYARKYALNGLLNLDDVKDADANEYEGKSDSKKEDKPKGEAKATKNQIDMIIKLYDEENIKKILAYYKVNALMDLTVKQASDAIANKKKVDGNGRN